MLTDSEIEQSGCWSSTGTKREFPFSESLRPTSHHETSSESISFLSYKAEIERLSNLVKCLSVYTIIARPLGISIMTLASLGCCVINCLFEIIWNAKLVLPVKNCTFIVYAYRSDEVVNKSAKIYLHCQNVNPSMWDVRDTGCQGCPKMQSMTQTRCFKLFLHLSPVRWSRAHRCWSWTVTWHTTDMWWCHMMRICGGRRATMSPCPHSTYRWEDKGHKVMLRQQSLFTWLFFQPTMFVWMRVRKRFSSQGQTCMACNYNNIFICSGLMAICNRFEWSWQFN